MTQETDKKVMGIFRTLLGLPEPWRMAGIQIKEQEKTVEIEVQWPPNIKVVCPECQRACATYDHQGMRWWRQLDTMGHTTMLCSRVPRSACPEHGIKTVAVPWAGPGSHFTMAFEQMTTQVLLMAQSQQAAAKHVRLGWQQVHNIQAAAVKRGLERRSTEHIKRVGLDEKSFGRGQHYGTVLTDLDGHRVLEVVEHREQASAQKALESLGEEQLKEVEVVALDMWPAFMNAAKTKAPNADLVHDRFHAMKYVNEGVDKVRKQENEELSAQSLDWLTGKKYLFLKTPSEWKAQERASFKELRHKDLKVTKAWGLKESFQRFWEFDTRVGARSFFDQWYQVVSKSRLEPMQKVADMFLRHIPGLLAYAVHKITNALTEGFNSKIQMIKSSARGFRSFENYRIAILFHCGKLDFSPQ